MKVLLAIQVMVETGEWSDSLPIVHEVESSHSSAVIEAIARQFNLPIRVTYPTHSTISECKTEDDLCNYISRLSGHYPRYEQKFKFPVAPVINPDEEEDPLYI
jgi:hypothetical protein